MSIIGGLVGALIVTYVLWFVNGRPRDQRQRDYILVALVLWVLLAILGYLAQR